MIPLFPRGGALAACFALGLALSTPVHAQKAAEQFIPMGQSPGLSGKTTLIGVVLSVEPASGKLTLTLPEGRVESLFITPSTRIWLDRSARKQPTLRGNPHDLIPGRGMEVNPEAGAPDQAEWIKVEPGAP